MTILASPNYGSTLALSNIKHQKGMDIRCTELEWRPNVNILEFWRSAPNGRNIFIYIKEVLQVWRHKYTAPLALIRDTFLDTYYQQSIVWYILSSRI